MAIDPLHKQGTHHWLLTLDRVGSRSGTCDWPSDESRYDLYLRIRALVLDAEHLADRPTPPTLFFDVQENLVNGGVMKKLKKITQEAGRTVRWLVSGRTTSAKNMRAFADYQAYAARERAAEERGER